MFKLLERKSKKFEFLYNHVSQFMTCMSDNNGMILMEKVWLFD